MMRTLIFVDRKIRTIRANIGGKMWTMGESGMVILSNSRPAGLFISASEGRDLKRQPKSAVFMGNSMKVWCC